MTSYIERHLGPCLFLLVLAAIAPSITEKLRTRVTLPAGYGAEGDRRRANPVPPLVRPAVEELSAGADGCGVKETVEAGAWVYELHLSRGGRSTVIRLSSNGHVIQPEAPEPDHSPVTGASG